MWPVATIFTGIQYLMRKLWLFIFLFSFAQLVLAQDSTIARRDTVVKKDTTAKMDSATLAKDTLAKAVDTVIVVEKKPSFLLDSSIYNHQPFASFKNPVMQIAQEREWNGKETFFYASVLLLMFFALVRNGFGRYSGDLFKLFFRTTVKQRQIKEQMMQSPLPSLLLNLLFFFSGALFINLLFSYFHLGASFGFWELFTYCLLGLMVIYLVKFITLKICGWIFRLSEATDAYTFIVFTTNKIIGVALLPFIILMAFTSGTAQQAVFTLSMIVIAGLFVYRYYLSYASIHRQVKINFFHFILYLFAFEVIPVLLINKLLLKFLSETP
jgi:hypothetical protein